VLSYNSALCLYNKKNVWYSSLRYKAKKAKPHMNNFLSYEVESVESETTSTAYAGVPLLVEAFLRLVSSQQLAELAQATGIRNTKTLVRHLVSLMSLMANGPRLISSRIWPETTRNRASLYATSPSEW